MGSGDREELAVNNLVLYKNRPARLTHVAGDRSADKLEIELENGETARVRPKDVILLHPGPLQSLNNLRKLAGEVEAAWQILAGERTTLAELAELIYGTFTPQTAWAAWQQVMDGLYFEGNPSELHVRTADEVKRRQQERQQTEANQRARADFLERLRRGQIIDGDRERLREVENLALGRGARSPLMRELGQVETAEHAHALLLQLGIWDEQVNPHPVRQGAALKSPDLPVPALPQEPRRDLTWLAAFAIDDEDTDTPDDALSYEALPSGGRLWVHVADASALVEPESELDVEARTRGESLHLPEGTAHLLPREVTLQAGLGMQEISPALSFAIDLDSSGEVTGFEMLTSLVRVTRLSYAEAEQRLEEAPFKDLHHLTSLVRDLRRKNGALMLDFPEARIKVAERQVHIHPFPALRSRGMVEEAMILAGSETARFASESGLGLPFSQQAPPDAPDRPTTLSGMFALRRQLKRSQYSTTPGAHSGLGVSAYTQITSPLRRYLDLVGHQQLRAFLKGQPMLTETEMVERIGAAAAVTGVVRQAELLSEKHWTLVYLLQHPGWRGEGILVDQRGSSGILILPDLALEVRVHLPRSIALDERVTVELSGVNLPQLEASFRIPK